MSYQRGDKLIVFKALGSVDKLKREFKRIIQFGRLNSLTLKQISKIKTKVVHCASEDTVEFTDGTIYWSSSVAKPGELKSKLAFFAECHNIPFERKKEKINRIKNFFSGGHYRF